MQATCPACETVFRMSETDASVASGMVQCGVCGRIFQAVEESTEPKADRGKIMPVKSAVEGGLPPILAEGYVALKAAAPWWQTMLWSFLILLALSAALLQLGWYHIDQLFKEPALSSLVESACQHLPCDLEQPSDMSKIELLSRDVRSHPNQENALLITSTFINHAEFDQPYPRVGITLSNLTGEEIASRYFKPEEYLGDDYQSDSLMPRNIPTTMMMEVVDPGEETVSYFFDFH